MTHQHQINLRFNPSRKNNIEKVARIYSGRDFMEDSNEIVILLLLILKVKEILPVFRLVLERQQAESYLTETITETLVKYSFGDNGFWHSGITLFPVDPTISKNLRFSEIKCLSSLFLIPEKTKILFRLGSNMEPT